MPTLRQLQYFLAVADLASFSRAAERLHIAQPALSRQIMALEEELGALLLARHTRLVSLTAAGQCLRQRAARLLDDLDETCDEVRRIDAGAGVRLRVLHSSSVALAGALGQALGRWLAANPGVQVEIDQVTSESQVAEVGEGRADLGLVRLPVLRRSVAAEIRPLGVEPLVVALAPGHPLLARERLALTDLAAETFVFHPHPDRGGLSRAVLELCQRQGFTPRPAAALSRKLSLLQLVALGFGVALIPASLAAVAPATVVCRHLAEAPTTEVALVLATGAAPFPATGTTRRALAASLGAALGAAVGRTAVACGGLTGPDAAFSTFPGCAGHSSSPACSSGPPAFPA